MMNTAFGLMSGKVEGKYMSVNTDSMSRSQLKVMEYSLEFRVRSTSPLPLERFSLNFTLVKCSSQ